MASCDLHTDSNGKLDGYWYLKQVDTLATGDIRDLSKVGSIFFLHERYQDTLGLYKPYRHAWHEDMYLESVDVLRDLGINSLDARFRILHLNGSNMILRDSLLELDFEKY